MVMGLSLSTMISLDWCCLGPTGIGISSPPTLYFSDPGANAGGSGIPCFSMRVGSDTGSYTVCPSRITGAFTAVTSSILTNITSQVSPNTACCDKSGPYFAGTPLGQDHGDGRAKLSNLKLESAFIYLMNEIPVDSYLQFSRV